MHLFKQINLAPGSDPDQANDRYEAHPWSEGDLMPQEDWEHPEQEVLSPVIIWWVWLLM
jgi:hypothetical protein